MDVIEKFKKILFYDDDHVCCGSLFDNEIMPFEDGVGSMFFTVNSIDNRNDHGHAAKDSYDFLKPRRADINVNSFRNFMFEMDDESLDVQLKILEGCEIPWSTITYSGGKSYHAILSIDTSLGGEHTRDGIDQYKNFWKRLSMKIEKYANSLGYFGVVDQSGKNPSRFTRYPETVRDNGNIQSILHMGSRISFSEFRELLKTCPKLFVSVVQASNILDIDSLQEFFDKAPQALVDEVKYPINLAPSGMYPRLLRLSLWCKDIGVSKDLWLNVLNYRMFPKLLSIGYPESKLEVAVDHAYKFGGSNE